MSLSLPGPIAAYFAAEQSGGDAIVNCFTENAVVIDERQTHTGREAIRRWKAEASAKFSYSVTPVAIAEQDKQTIVTGHVVGDFPGSPIDLRYAFELDGAHIAKLEIKP